MVPEDRDVATPTDNSSPIDLPDTSYASIQKPELADPGQDQHVLLWGRFWSEARKLGVAFAFNYNLDALRFRTNDFLVVEDLSKLKDFDPDQHFTRFKRDFRGKKTSSSVPNATVKQVEETFKSYLTSEQNERTLVEYLKNKNRDEFSDEIYELVHKVFTKGTIIYQFKAELSTLQDGSSQETDRTHSEDEDTTEKDPSGENDKNYVTVKPVTSPMKGKFPRELNVGETVFVRTTGSVTENLPETMQSEKHENLSVPIESTVQTISADVTLPSDFDGTEEDYWELTVELLEGNDGKAFLHKNTQIKTDTDDETSTEGTGFSSPLLLIGAGLSLLACVFLALYIFGV
jgi:hypothetical protein